MKNYRKFKVLETLTAEADVSAAAGGGGGTAGSTDDSLVGIGSSSSASSPASWSTGLMRARKTLRAAPAPAAPAAAPLSASFLSPDASGGNGGEGGGPAGGEKAPAIPTKVVAAVAGAAAAASGEERRGDAATETAAAGGRAMGGARAGAADSFVTAKEMAAIKDPGAFHEALTLPYTGDPSVEAYFQRIGDIMNQDLSSVRCALFNRWGVREVGPQGTGGGESGKHGEGFGPMCRFGCWGGCDCPRLSLPSTC